MNRLELKKVMKFMNINHILPKGINNKYYNLEDVYFWNNLKIYFSGQDYAVVYGIIPQEVSNIIGNNENNSGEYEIPIRHTDNEEYEINIQCKNIKYNIFLESIQKIKKALKIKNDKKEINTYRIYTKEKFLLFLLSIEAYYSRSNNTTKTIIKRYEELITKINCELLKEIDLSNSAYDWMQNNDTYNLSIEKDQRTINGNVFRETISNFDKAINPFLNNNIEFDEILQNLSNTMINAETYRSNDESRKKCCSLQINDYNNVGNSTTYYRNSDGFNFQLIYRLDDNSRLKVSHYFISNGNSVYDKGEYITIESNNYDENINIILNITNWLLINSNGEQSNVNTEQLSFIYNKLLEATTYAKNITNKNTYKKIKKIS